MRILKQFDEFVKEGVANRVSINKSRALSLSSEAERKMTSLRIQLEKIGIQDFNANDFVEYCYDLLMNLVRAKMHMDGYSASGQCAHEAEVSYLRKMGFSEKDVLFMDQLRFFRNGILYYGTNLDIEYAEKVTAFTMKSFLKLKEIVSANPEKIGKK